MPATDPNAQPVRIYRHSDGNLRFTPTTPTDITGWSLEFAVSTRPGATTYLIFLDSAGGKISIITAGTGVFEVDLTAAVTALANGVYYWDVWRVGTGVRNRLAGGVFVVDQPVNQNL